MIYATDDPYYHSFLSGAGVQQQTFSSGGGRDKGVKARGSDGKYQGE